MTSVQNTVSSRAFQSIHLNSLLSGKFSNRKLTLPLNGKTPYIQFKHVQGIHSTGDTGYSIPKLQLLDNLIEYLTASGSPVSIPAGNNIELFRTSAGSPPGQKLNLLV